MKPLKILAALLLVLVIGACNSDGLDETNFNSTTLSKSDASKEDMDDGCETAFAKYHPFCEWYGYVFVTDEKSNPDGFPSLNLTKNRWGWAVNIKARKTHTFDLWAGAAKNDTSKGTKVGEVTISYDGLKTIVSYSIFEGFTMKEAHIYADDVPPTTIAPGQYGYTTEFSNGVTSYTVELDVRGNRDGSGLWVIAHAVVCAV